MADAGLHVNHKPTDSNAFLRLLITFYFICITDDSPDPASLLFFSGPIGLLFLINLILFILTLRYCNRVKREIFRMQSSNNEKPILKRRFFVDKARFAMNTKLFVVMGITWFLELLSIIFYDHKKIFFWAISDSFNVLQGVFVFFIFVFKKRVWHSVLEKLGKYCDNIFFYIFMK